MALVASTAPTRSPRASSGPRAPERAAPRPATMAGRREEASRSTTAATELSGGNRRLRAVASKGCLGEPSGQGFFDHVDRDAQDDGSAFGLGAPERSGGICCGGLGSSHALWDRAERRREGRLIHLEVRPERPRGDVGGQQDERRARLRGLRQPRERVRKARALMDARDAEFSAGAGVAVRHHDRAGLVPGGVESGARLVQARSGRRSCRSRRARRTASTPPSTSTRPIASETRTAQAPPARISPSGRARSITSHHKAIQWPAQHTSRPAVAGSLPKGKARLNLDRVPGCARGRTG